MAQHHRQRNGSVAVHEVAVAAADTRGTDLYQDLPLFGVVQFDVFNHQGRFRFVQNGCLQCNSPDWTFLITEF